MRRRTDIDGPGAVTVDAPLQRVARIIHHTEGQDSRFDPERTQRGLSNRS